MTRTIPDLDGQTITIRTTDPSLTLLALYRVQDGFRFGDPRRPRLRLLELETYILKRLERPAAQQRTNGTQAGTSFIRETK